MLKAPADADKSTLYNNNNNKNNRPASGEQKVFGVSKHANGARRVAADTHQLRQLTASRPHSCHRQLAEKQHRRHRLRQSGGRKEMRARIPGATEVLGCV